MIDTSTWKKFKIEDLFDIKLPSARSEKNYSEGNTRYVSSGAFNNGVANYLEPKLNETLDKGHCITVSPLDGASFWQDEDFMGRGGSGASISMLYNDNLNELRALFICSVIRNTAQRFGYSDLLNSTNLKTLELTLPATSDGQPDWDYMESYMKAVMEESEKSLENLRKADDTKHLIDVSGWGEFDITELFDMSLPKGDLQVKKVDDGNIPLITPSNFNNGMLQRISEHSPSTLYDKGSLTVDMFGNAYYQEEDFFVTAHGHVNVLLPKVTLNVYTGTFLASTIRTMFFDKYGFNEMCTQKVLKSESIWLPITSTGEPDWQYMEDYMRRIMDKSEQIISDLQTGE